MAALKSALPAHLKPSSLAPGDANAEFARKHHGKTQSHMFLQHQPESGIIRPYPEQVPMACPTTLSYWYSGSK
ncbi:hypothetical protein LOCC1_G006291 [Lachnellula occidentalis]|uniref:Uncharacterized protein n=1 Tax=Lachnellula occidentalis TaxID=215460 RepID=A0A8H8UC31_9HELO|nr:hypothetical protein LOCC1_G006291 [Lachnellula occidentalis]